MWSDTLLAAERCHLLRVILWAVTSATLGTILLLIITIRRVVAPVVQWFATQALVWGLLELVVAAASWRSLGMRDVSESLLQQKSEFVSRRRAWASWCTRRHQSIPCNFGLPRNAITSGYRELHPLPAGTLTRTRAGCTSRSYIQLRSVLIQADVAFPPAILR